MEKSLSSIGNYLDSTLSTSGRNVLDWLSSANPIVLLLLGALVIAFFFTPMLRYYYHRIYWTIAKWRDRVMVRRYRRISVDSKIADAVVGVIEDAVLKDELSRAEADARYRDIGTCCGIVDLLPRKKPRKLHAFLQTVLKNQIRDRIPDVDKKLEAVRENSNGKPPKVARKRITLVHG